MKEELKTLAQSVTNYKDKIDSSDKSRPHTQIRADNWFKKDILAVEWGKKSLEYHFMGLVMPTEGELRSQIGEEHFGIFSAFYCLNYSLVNYFLIHFSFLFQFVSFLIGVGVDKDFFGIGF